MTTKEFVNQQAHYPEAFEHPWFDYFVIRAAPMVNTFIGTGKTIDEAWESAKQNIERTIRYDESKH